MLMDNSTPRQTYFSERDWSGFDWDDALGQESNPNNYDLLPESGGYLLSHDLSNVANQIYSSAEDSYSASIFDFETEEFLEPDHYEVGRRELFEVYRYVKSSDYDALKDLEGFLDKDVEGIPRKFVEWVLNIGKAAEDYEELRKGKKDLESRNLEDAIWAFEKDPGIEVKSDVSIEGNQILATNALLYVSSTFVKNVYDNNVDGDTTLKVREEDDCFSFILKSPRSGDLQDPLVYDPDSEDGFGIPVSNYILDRLAGNLEVEQNEESFSLTYSLKKNKES